MGDISKIKLPNNDVHNIKDANALRIMYGVCSSGASTVGKTVSVSNWPVGSGETIPDGTTIKVKFTKSNTASNPTLNVNSSGAFPIKKYGTSAPGAITMSSWLSGTVVSLTFDGTSWQMNDHTDDTRLKKTLSSANVNYPLIVSDYDITNTDDTVSYSYVNNSIYANLSTGTIFAQDFNINGNTSIKNLVPAVQSSNITLSDMDGYSVGSVKAGYVNAIAGITGYVVIRTYAEPDSRKMQIIETQDGGYFIRYYNGVVWTDFSNSVSDKVNILEQMNGAKNLLSLDLSEIIALNSGSGFTWNGNVCSCNGVTITVNSDGTISTNGTLSDSKDINFAFKSYGTTGTTELGNYVLSGCPDGGNYSEKYAIYCGKMAGGQLAFTSNSSGVVIPNTEPVKNIKIMIRKSTDMSNLTFKPMICTQEAWNAGFKSYQPYSFSNTIITPELIELVDNGSKNKLNITQTSQSGYTTQFINNYDGTFSLDGTCSASSAWNIALGTVTIPPGDWILDIKNANSGDCLYAYEDQTFTSNSGPKHFNTETTLTIMFEFNGNSTYSSSTILQPMLCSATAWGISNKFTPYAPSNLKVFNSMQYKVTKELSSGTATFTNIIREAARRAGYTEDDVVHYQFSVWSDVYNELIVGMGLNKYGIFYNNQWIYNIPELGCTVDIYGTIALAGWTGTTAYISVRVY